MSWRMRAWRGAFFAVLLAATWLLLRPSAGGPDPFPGWDKLAHALLFAGLALLAARAYRGHPRWGVFAALAVYGACVEIAQLRVGRSGEVLDLAADAVGAAAVFLLPARRLP